MLPLGNPILRAFAAAWAGAFLLAPASPLPATELRVFVTNEKSNNVTVIDGAAHKVIATVQMGERPRGIVASADGKFVYVANSNSNDISTIDSKTLAVLNRFPAGIDPEGITVDRRGRLYAVNENDSALTIIDLGSRKLHKRLEVGTEPETAVLSPDERWVVVSNESSHEIHFIDTVKLEIAGKVAVPRNPRGMRFSADSRQLFVASEADNQLSLIDVESRQLLRSVPTGGERPVDITLSKDGERLFISHGRSEDVRVFERATLKFLTAIPVGPRAWWMALSPDGRWLYVTVGRASQLVVIDTHTDQVVARVQAGELPWGVALVEVKN
jgi:PQQ-dependent catabolism-associated beta-propeller protein